MEMGQRVNGSQQTKVSDALIAQITGAKKYMSLQQTEKMLMTVLELKKGEKVLFLTDYPKEPETNENKRDRHNLLVRWYEAAERLSKKIGFELLPLVTYLETGTHGAQLPQTAVAGDKVIENLTAHIREADVVIAMTSFSATAPLQNIAKEGRIRAMSMPTVDSSMEPAMAVDYDKVNARGEKLLEMVKQAVGFEVEFKGEGVPAGTKLYVDTRANVWELDGGKCTEPGKLINFPAGELFTPPYEGASILGQHYLGASQTSGTWAVYSPSDQQVVLLKVEKNRIVEVPGESAKANELRKLIAEDPNNANIAELAFGLNEAARPFEHVSILEKEKAGPHIAYGRNDLFGTPESIAGKVMASTHVDEVYTPITPITVDIHAVYYGGSRILIAENGKVVAV